MDRTLRAALLAAVIIAGTVGGLGSFLGFPAVGSIVTGIVLGLLAGLLLWGAGRRADTFHPTDPDAHLAEHRDERPDDQTPGA